MIFPLSIRSFASNLKPVSLMRLTQVDDPTEALKDTDASNVVVEWKYDGIRGQAIKKDGKVKLYTRRGNEITENLPMIVKQLESLPNNTLVEGELVYWESKNKQDEGAMMSVAGGAKETAETKLKELGGQVKFHLFDILYYKGKDITDKTFEERKKLLKSIVKSSKNIEITKDYPFKDWEKVMKDAMANGCEGIVLKKKNEDYDVRPAGKPETKTRKMLKYKGGIGKSETDDVVVIRLEKSKTGKVVAIFGQYYKGKLYEISKISNFSKETEEEMKKKIKKGKFTIEIGFQERLPGGFRHQKWIRFRDKEKKPKDATMSKIHIDNIVNFEEVKKAFYLSKRDILIKES